MNRPILSAAALGLAALLTGCSTTAGEPVNTPSGAPSGGSPAGTTHAVPAGLDTGGYPTTAVPVPAPTPESAWVMEGNRMADALIQVNQVDPRMVIGGAALRSFPVLSGNQLRTRVPDATAEVFQRSGMRVGMTTTRGDTLESPRIAMRIGLYRFGTPEAATKAFEAVKVATARLRPIPVTGTDGVSAAEFKPGTVDSYRAEGPFVINISGTDSTTAAAAQLVAKGYEQQLPQLRKFTPTPDAEIGRLATDVNGALGRTLPQDSDTEKQELSTGAFGIDGVLHRISDIRSADVYRAAGVDSAAQRGSVVYRTSDESAAQTLAAELAKSTPTRAQPKAPSPAQLPQSPCYQRSDSKVFACVVVVGRWVGTANGSSLIEAQRKASAQYVILANAR
ncbi:hypothetical protein GCM10027289_21040 [Tsukamurella serpentis]